MKNDWIVSDFDLTGIILEYDHIAFLKSISTIGGQCRRFSIGMRLAFCMRSMGSDGPTYCVRPILVKETQHRGKT